MHLRIQLVAYHSRLWIDMSHVDSRVKSHSWRFVRVILVTEQFQSVDATLMHRLHQQ